MNQEKLAQSEYYDNTYGWMDECDDGNCTLEHRHNINCRCADCCEEYD